MPNANFGPDHALAQRFNNIETQLRNMATSPWLLHASTGQGGGLPGITIDTNGVHAFDATGKNIVGMLTADGSITAYDATGSAVARFGPLTNSHPGSYGIEVLIGGSWVQVGAGAVDWVSVANKPASYPPSAHTHAGADVTSRVASATDAIGSASGYANPVQGTSFVAAWLGNDGSNSFGRNTSSIKYKTNVRAHDTDPANVLKLQPVLYDRISGGANEYGLIAEQVHEHVPELVSWFDGQIDSVRYDLLSVALLDVVKHQNARLEALETAMTTLKPGYATPPASPVTPNMPANGAPSPEPTPTPYMIAPQK